MWYFHTACNNQIQLPLCTKSCLITLTNYKSDFCIVFFPTNLIALLKHRYILLDVLFSRL